MRRPVRSVLRSARRSWRVVAVVACITVVLTGAHHLRYSGQVSAQGRLVPPAGSPPAAADCEQQAVRIVSPGDGASLLPGPVMVVGVGPATSPAFVWRLHDASGALVSSGSADTTTLQDTGAFLVRLDLRAGSYRLEVARGGLAALRSDVLPCPAAHVSVTVGPDVAEPTWTSGAAGEGVADGRFAEWRGTAVPVAGTWADSNEGQEELWQLQPGEEFGAWDGDLEIAIGAIDGGETWAEAARGAYDDRWATSLQEMARLWAGRSGTLSIRFAHEMNGDWYPWSVTNESADDFVAAWSRFRALQVQHFPAARLVFTPNWETPGHLGMDWRDLFPGADQVDVISIPYFDSHAHPGTGTAEDFWELALSSDDLGAPRGIVQHLEFARSVGLPFAVSEWGPHAGVGDDPVYVEEMHRFFRANAGTGAGKLQYEVLFNVVRDDNPFALMPPTRVPLAAETYRRLW